MSADSGTKTNQTAMTTQPASRTLGRLTSAANRPAAAAPGSPFRRALAMLTERPRRHCRARRRTSCIRQSWHLRLRDTRARHPSVGDPISPPPEQLVELALPFALFLRRHQHRDNLLLRQHVDDAGRVRLHVLARRQPPELGEELP